MTTLQTPRAATLPQTGPELAATVTGHELDALLALLRGLDDEAWDAPTDCTGWSVTDIVKHLAGAFEEAARLRVMLRHSLTAGRRHPGRDFVDALNQMQLDDRADDSARQLVDELALIGPAGIRGRRRLPSMVRRIRVPAKGGLPAGSTLGYLNDVIYPRDLWMHRVDVCRATGTDLACTEAESEVVRQVVRDLDRSWDGPTFALTLTGHAAGTWLVGAGSPESEVTGDAVDVMRLLSGRTATADLVSTGDQRARDRLVTSRVVF
jgi:uncharacterized protein (TIGR03083 family)